MSFRKRPSSCDNFLLDGGEGGGRVRVSLEVKRKNGGSYEFSFGVTSSWKSSLSSPFSVFLLDAATVTNVQFPLHYVAIRRNFSFVGNHKR